MLSYQCYLAAKHIFHFLPFVCKKQIGKWLLHLISLKQCKFNLLPKRMGFGSIGKRSKLISKLFWNKYILVQLNLPSKCQLAVIQYDPEFATSYCLFSVKTSGWKIIQFKFPAFFREINCSGITGEKNSVLNDFSWNRLQEKNSRFACL